MGLPNRKKGSLGKEYPISVPHPKRLSLSWRQEQIHRVPGGQCLEQCQGTGLARFPSPSQDGLSQHVSESTGQIARLKHFTKFSAFGLDLGRGQELSWQEGGSSRLGEGRKKGRGEGISRVCPWKLSLLFFPSALLGWDLKGQSNPPHHPLPFPATCLALDSLTLEPGPLSVYVCGEPGRKIIPACIMLYHLQSISLVSPPPCDPHNNSKVDVRIPEQFCSFSGIPLSGARESMLLF